MPASPTLLLVDDHAMFRTGLGLVLRQGLPQLRVIEAASFEAAVDGATAAPGMVLLDIQLPGLNGLDGVVQLRQRWPQCPVVMLSSHDDAATRDLAMARGAAAFVSKAESAEMILSVVVQVLGAVSVVPPPSAPQALAAGNATPVLTPRQSEVLNLLSQGLPNKVIARQMGVSENTVRGHVQAVLEAFNVSSRSEAAYAARRQGMIV